MLWFLNPASVLHAAFVRVDIAAVPSAGGMLQHAKLAESH